MIFSGGGFAKELHLAGDRNVYLSFRFLYCELAKLPAETYMSSDNIVARLNLPNMQCAPEQRVEVYARAIEGLLSLESDWNRQRKYIDFIDAYADLDEEEALTYRTDYVEQFGEKTMGVVSALLEEAQQQGVLKGVQQGVQQGLQQGVQQGLQQGVQQGKKQGESLLLRRQLARRFGDLPFWAEKRLAEAETEQLELWAETLLDAASLEDVFTADSP